MQLVAFTENEYSILINWINSEALNYLWGGSLYTYPLTYQQITLHCNQAEVYPYLFKVQGEHVGYVELCKESTSCFRVCRVLISEPYKGKGYAKPMLHQLIEQAKSLGATTLTLAVFEHNAVALSLYQTLGFKTISTAPFRLPTYHEAWQLVRMEKRLQQP